MNKLLLPLLLCLAAPAFTQSAQGQIVDQMQEAPIIYNRMILRLIPKPEPKQPPSPLPQPRPLPMEEEKKLGPNELNTTKAEQKKQEEQKELRIAKAPMPEEPPVPTLPPRAPIDFTVDSKSQDFLNQDDFITHTEFADREGLLIEFDPPAKTAVSGTRMISTSDVIFINEDGIITRIAPRLNLSELEESVSSGAPVRAILYIKPGGVEQDRIVPGDRFENSIFKTHPVILQ